MLGVSFSKGPKALGDIRSKSDRQVNEEPSVWAARQTYTRNSHYHDSPRAEATRYDAAMKIPWRRGAALSLLACALASNSQTQQAVESLPPGIVSKEEPRTFEEAVAKINASSRFFEALANQPDPGPAINLNLLRYRPRGDNSRYGLYATVAVKEILELGGSVPFYGNAVTQVPGALDASSEWDGIAYVVFPKRAGYLELQESADYQAAIPDRVAGTYERMLYVLSDGDSIYEAAESIEHLHETKGRIALEPGNVVLSEFLRFKKPGGRRSYERFAREFGALLKAVGGEVLLSVQAAMPIISEQYWDHFVSFKFPSLKVLGELYQSDEFHGLEPHRTAGLESTLAVLANPGGVPSGSN